MLASQRRRPGVGRRAAARSSSARPSAQPVVERRRPAPARRRGPVARLGAGRAVRRQRGRAGWTGRCDALLVALAARRLQQARGGEAEREPAGGDRPRVAAGEVLDVARGSGRRRSRLSHDRRRAPRGRRPGRRASPARPCPARAAARATSRRSDARAECTCSPACVERWSTCSRTRSRAWPVAWLHLLAGLLANVLRLLLRLFLDAAVPAVRCGGGAGICGSRHGPLLLSDD